MGKTTTKTSNLGRSLIRDRFGHDHRRTTDNNSMIHTAELQDGYNWGRLNLQSVTEESSFQEFLRTAELAGTEFQAEKMNITFVNPKSNIGILTSTERATIQKKHADVKDLLKIPRRPKWTVETTSEELKNRENESFLNWRRDLALLQENDGVLLTPYEKNLEFWRQLWRVVERSDVIVQIVDARNPELFRSEDLEAYVKEVDSNKMNMILVNKADFLTEAQRVVWADYFQNFGIKIAFFSATLAAQKNLESIGKDDSNPPEDKSSSDELANSDDEAEDKTSSTLNLGDLKSATNDLLKAVQKSEEQLNKIENLIEEKINYSQNISKILSRLELIQLFKNIHHGKRVTDGRVTIGLVGYPNVGKSSTINSLMIEKKVSVSATPGKTKHFQTLNLDNDLILCDCPGLVMPSFVLTKAEMILNGILPIDQMRDFVPPVNVLCSQIPRHILEDKYGIIIAKPMEGEDPNRPPYAEELLLAYGYNRGFMTANGQPDQSRSARYVLKDYVAGRLLYCHAPTGVDQYEFHPYPQRVKHAVEEKDLPGQQQRAMRINRTQTSKELDSSFFRTTNNTPFIKGKTNLTHIRGYVAPENHPISSSSSNITNGSMQNLSGVQYVEKPWRQKKKEKKEKLRNKYAYLDQH